MLKHYHIDITQDDIYLVPGAFEIPYMVEMVINHKQYDAIICLGCLIKGESDHYESTKNVVIAELMHLATKHMLPIVNGVLNVLDLNQAQARSGFGVNGLNLGKEYSQGLCQMWIDNHGKF